MLKKRIISTLLVAVIIISSVSTIFGVLAVDNSDKIVNNGSFEDDFTGWTANYNTIDSAQASDGEKSANLVKWYHLTQEVNVEKGASYTFSFDVYNTEGIWTWARILASDGTSALYELQVNQSFGQSGWETISGTFEAGENETVSIDFVADSGNGMKIDNIRIEKIKYKTEPLDGNTIPIEQDKDYTFTIIHYNSNCYKLVDL